MRHGQTHRRDLAFPVPHASSPMPLSPMNAFILLVTALCFGYLVYAMLRPERF